MPENPGSTRCPSRGERDHDELERAVLAHVLDLHPIQLTLAELVREMTDAPDDFAARDPVELAVRQLTRTGLLRCHGPFVVPTRAALRAFELSGR